MEKLIEQFPANIEEALQIANNASFKSPKNTIKNVVICGMGGSGIGGRLVSNWVLNEIKVPVQCFHDYVTPTYIDENTLVIASSYSGNTEETLIFVEQAKSQGAHIIGVCSGGQLEAFCRTNDLDCIVVPGGNPPRTALAFSLVQLTNILNKLGLISGIALQQIESARQLLVSNNLNIKKEALKLAEFLNTKAVPVFYAETPYEAVLVRAKQQFNENSKVLCWTHVIPEMNHNELVGWGGGDDRFAAVFFDTEDLLARNKKRVEITLEVIVSKTKLLTIKAKGNNQIERSFYLINIVDWASFYLAELNNVDSIEIKIIERLKSELANFSDK